MKRIAPTKNGTESFVPHEYRNGCFRVEIEIGSGSELHAAVKSGEVAGHKITGVRMKGHLGSGPSVVPIDDIDL